MSRLSLKQAAEFAGTTKPTILKHIQAGKVSAEKDAEGRWWLDLAELRRAYGEPESRTVAGNGSEDDGLHPLKHPPSSAETPALVAELRRQVEELRADKADLRRRLDEREETAREGERRLLAVIEKQAEQVKLLADQRPAPRPGFWRRLLGR